MSNLLQKASIITTSTAYDTGKILSVKPVEYYGPELVTNGDFATDSDWTKDAGWTISGGKAIATSSNVTSIYQELNFIDNKSYKITFDITEYTSGEVACRFNNDETNRYNSVGTHTLYFISNNSFDYVYFVGYNFFTGSIDNVSVKEVFNADFDFTRNSSATRVGSNGLIQDVASNIPRIDYTGGVGSWKFEPQRTNLLSYSEDFSQGWNLSSATISSNSIISPDGLVNATTLDISAFGGGLTDSLSVPNGNVTFSLFVKKNTTNGIRLRIDASTDSNGFFDLVNNTVYSSTDDASIESYGNDWYKVSISANITSFSKVAIYGTNGSNNYQNGSVYIYGAQLEVGSFPTSYIPTSGQSGGVTRLADVANNAGSSDLINSTEGVLYAEISALADDVENKFMSISNGSNTEVLRIAYISGTDIRFETAMTSGTNFQKDVEINLSDNNKVCFQYKSNEYKVFVNGFSYSVTQRSTTPTGLNELSFDRGDGLRNFYGNTKSVAVFKEALTDLELECLVSWMSFSDLGINFGYTVE